MKSHSRKYQVVIVGGGPVGLFLGLCLEQVGISYIILEKRSEPHPGSRSLGIHPVSLELFSKLGIEKPLLINGIKIHHGHAFSNTQKLGSLSFNQCPPPFNFILALPQTDTETLLEQELCTQNPDALLRDATVTKVINNPQKATINFTHGGQACQVQCRYVIGCDGTNSMVRDQANISFKGQSYPDTYIMGDFHDNTGFGSDAAIYLCNEGLIESFPLPDNQRRWVVKTDDYISEVTKDHLTSKIANRIGHSLNELPHFMLSSFGVQKFIAKPMVKNRIILCGDAAHIISPIGGQGMNLGWLDAWDLAHTLSQAFANTNYANTALTKYQQRRTHAAHNAIRRAELNMRLGRKSSFPRIRNIAVSAMLMWPLNKIMAQLFTMRGIERGLF